MDVSLDTYTQYLYLFLMEIKANRLLLLIFTEDNYRITATFDL